MLNKFIILFLSYFFSKLLIKISFYEVYGNNDDKFNFKEFLGFLQTKNLGESLPVYQLHCNLLIAEILITFILSLTIMHAHSMKDYLLIPATANMIILALMDILEMMIDLKYVIINLVLSVIYSILSLSFNIESFRFLILFTLVFIAIYYFSKKSVGIGDYYVYMSILLFFKYKLNFILMSLYIAFAFSIIILLIYRNLKMKVPYVFFISLAFILVKLDLLSWRLI